MRSGWRDAAGITVATPVDRTAPEPGGRGEKCDDVHSMTNVALVAANSGGTTRSVDHRRGIGGRGILSVFRGAVLWRVVLIVAGLLVGPGGVSVFN